MDFLHIVEEAGRGPGEEPDGPIVVLVHGTLDRAASFTRTARRLGQEGLRTIRYDRRGYGRSLPAGPGGIDEHVEDLLAVLDGRPATIAGHSFGGVVALTAAVRAPALIRSVYAYEAPTPWADWWPRQSAGGAALARSGEGAGAAGDAAEAFMRRMIGDAHWERLPESTRRQRRDEGPALLVELASLRRSDPPYRPEQLRSPVVAGCGSRSATHHRRAAEALAAAAPDGRLDEVEGADHGVHLTHPSELARRILAAVRGGAER